MTISEETIMLPEAFVRKMQRLLGHEEQAAFFASYEKERAQGLRRNPLKARPAEFQEHCARTFSLSPVPWCQEGYYYPADARPGRHPYHEAGVYYIQEPSAMAVVELLDPRPGERVLDLCAAPGGKTSHAAGKLLGEGLLVSNEIHPARAKILSRNVERMGISNCVVTNEDSGRLSGYFPDFFDKIIVDAPCSGEGMFRKDQKAREEWSEENVALCVRRQQEILDNAASMLRPGGRMVYSTCTFSPEEDEEGIAAFLDRHPEFSVVSVPQNERLPGLSRGRADWIKRSCPAVSDTYRIWPHLAEGEGHFLALLKKAEAEGKENGRKADRQSRKEKPPKFWKDPAGQKVVSGFFAETCRELPAWAADYEKRMILYADQVYLVPEGMIAMDGLRALRPGLHLGTLKKNRFDPAHALALALEAEKVCRAVSFPADSPEIIGYLSGQTLPSAPGEKGWTLVCVDGFSLGWAKASAGILKNHYPRGLRIVSG